MRARWPQKLPAGRIAGILDAARIGTFDAAKVGSGGFRSDQVPPLDASQVGSGTFRASQLPASSNHGLTFRGSHTGKAGAAVPTMGLTGQASIAGTAITITLAQALGGTDPPSNGGNGGQ